MALETYSGSFSVIAKKCRIRGYIFFFNCCGTIKIYVMLYGIVHQIFAYCYVYNYTRYPIVARALALAASFG